MVIKTESVNVTFKKRDGSIATDHCIATLHKFDGETYGNGTSVSIVFDEYREPYLYDTRYETELWDPDNFGRWVRDFIANEVFTNVVRVD